MDKEVDERKLEKVKKIAAVRAVMYSLLIIAVMGASSRSEVRGQERRENAAWREMNERARRVEPVILEAAKLYGVDPRALWTIAYLETRFRPELVSPKGARGMMQFMPATATRFGLNNPHHTVAAIHAAARYVRFLAARFDNRLDLVLAGYNAGEGAVEAYLRGVALRTSEGRVINPNRLRTSGIPPYTETRNYVARGVAVARAVAASNIFSTADLTANNRSLQMPSTEVSENNQSVDSLAPVNQSEEAAHTPHIIPTSRYAANERSSAEVRQPTNVQESSAHSIRTSLTATNITVATPRVNGVPANARESNLTQPRSTYIRTSAPRR